MLSKGGKIIGIIFTVAIFGLQIQPAAAAYRFANFRGRPPIHIFGKNNSAPQGMTPEQIKKIYHLPTTGGHGTIAIIGAYDDKTIEKDLNTFSKQFYLPACTESNGCFHKQLIGGGTKTDAGWALETSLDVEWSHAIAPKAKILLVAAKTPSGKNLLDAIDYATKQPEVVAISMSWGGAEFPDETSLDSHFISKYRATFFASSGDNGAGVSWPAASPNVVAVGGTSLASKSETAWDGSGGGVSAFESEPSCQINYKISKANGHRAIPDVAYDADPASGFSVYRSSGAGKNNWYVLGGTSAGAPQWAAIKSLGLSADNAKFYADKAGANHNKYFNDIRSGSNGDCGYFCEARRHYDFVTGLGSPLTANF